MKLSIRDNSEKKSMKEANRWGKFDGLHYMVADQDIDSWRQEDYINVMCACRDLRRALDTYEKYGIDYENDPKYAERIEDMNAKISELIDIANQNAAQWDGESIVREGRTESKSLKKESQESSSPYYDFQNFLGRIDDYIDENGILLETKGTRFVNGKYNQTFEIILYGAYSNEEITTISLDYERRDGYLPWSATFDFEGTYDEDSADYINDLYDTITGWIDEVVKNDYR